MGFITFRTVSMATHATARDVLVTLQRNFKIMQHLSYKSTSFAKKSDPIHSETSDRGLKVLALSFSRASLERIMVFCQEVTRLSCDGKADSKLRLVFSVNHVVASGLTRLRNGDGCFREPRISSNFFM